MAKRHASKISDQPVLLVAELPSGRDVDFALTATADQLDAGKAQLDLLDLQKLRLEGRLRPEGRADWVLEARIGSTVTQACVVTLAPVRTRIEDEVTRRYLSQWNEPEGDSVVEMDEDVESEPLGPTIDLFALALEAIALAMPDYPRAPDAELGEAVFAEPGVTAMTDEAAKPFAGLAALREKMDK